MNNKQLPSKELRIIVAMLLAGVITAAQSQDSSADAKELNEDSGYTITKDGTVHISDLKVPPSSFLSPEAKKALIERTGFSLIPMNLEAETIEEVRTGADNNYKPFAEKLQKQYPVNIEVKEIGGVETNVITPAGSMPNKNKNRVLINVHGGGFVIGWPNGALTESVPIAGVTRTKVVTVNYRMAPEYQFPAASEDLAAVYRALLKQYRPENIGIYGCSAGGILTAQAIPWIDKVGLPKPGAIGVFGAPASGWGGDSVYVATALAGFPNLNNSKYLTYLSNVKPDNPLAYPVNDPKTLATFPPTLWVNSTRDPGVSGTFDSHAKALKAGVDSRLLIGEGLWHCYIFDDIPEAREAYEVIARFFDHNLGTEPVTKTE